MTVMLGVIHSETDEMGCCKHGNTDGNCLACEEEFTAEVQAECSRAATEIDRLREENAMLRTGDTCARQCDGTAYRIELWRARQTLAEIVRVLGPAAPDCDGCAAEIAEALRIAKASGFVTSNVGIEPRR